MMVVKFPHASREIICRVGNIARRGCQSTHKRTQTHAQDTKAQMRERRGRKTKTDG